jgi:hypothetical protein
LCFAKHFTTGSPDEQTSQIRYQIARQMGLLLNFGMPTMKEGITSVVL